MKRWAIRICFFLILGAIANVLVAWGLAVSSPIRHTHTHMPRIEPLPPLSAWQASLDEAIAPAAAIVQFEMRGLCRDGCAVSAMTQHGERIWLFMRNGWPLRSLAYAAEFRIADGSVVGHWGIVMQDASPDGDIRSLLPLRPIWPGFAINTVFYALVLWLLFAAPFALRRLRGGRRIKRGLCPKCAYDLRGSSGETCPECGAAGTEVMSIRRGSHSPRSLE